MKWSWLENLIRWLDRRVFAFLGFSRRAKMAHSLEIVQAVLHKRLSRRYSEKYPGHPPLFYDHMASVVLAHLFGDKPSGGGVESFAREQRTRIEQVLKLLPQEFPRLRPEITRALYVKALLDDLEPSQSNKIFQNVTELGLFDSEMNIPDPKEYFDHALRLARETGFGGD